MKPTVHTTRRLVEPVLMLCLLFCFSEERILAQTSASNRPLGYWEDHFSYHEARTVATDGKIIYAAAEAGVFSWDPKQDKPEKYSKVNRLSDVGVALMEYHKKTRTLALVYENGNMDLIQNGKLYNVPDLKYKTISGEKKLLHIAFSDSAMYLSCSFGIVVVDLYRHEINDTYVLGDNSSYLQVNAAAIDDTAVFAATPGGILWGHRKNKALADNTQWHKWKPLPDNLESANVDHIVCHDGKLYISIKNQIDDISTVYEWKNKTWQPIASQSRLLRLKETDGCLMLFSFQELSLYDFLGQRIARLDWLDPFSVYSLEAHDALVLGGKIWLAHRNRGLVEVPSLEATWGISHLPSGPTFNGVFSLAHSAGGKVYACAGSRGNTFGGAWIRANVATYDKGEWSDLNLTATQDTLYDVLFVAPDPLDDKHLFAAAWGKGILEIRDNEIVEVFNEGNTQGKIQPHFDGSSRTVRTTGVQFDRGGNLIAIQSLVPQCLAWRDKNGRWDAFPAGDVVDGNSDLAGLMVDNTYNYKWLWNRANTIYVFNNDGNVQIIDPNRNASLLTSAVNCMTEDRNGDVWIGTDQGVKVIYNARMAVEKDAPGGSYSKAECQNIKYTENGQTQYLLQFEFVTSIAVDGANRKWIGTRNGGVFVLSPNGSEEIYHFTSNNSPLPTDNITDIAIEPRSGRVFISSPKGMVAYKAEAIQGAETFSQVEVYPNPVKPDYTGEILIKGLKTDANVRITNVAGYVVNNLQAFGGQAIWNGKNFDGHPVASGVYLVFCADEQGNETAVTKIMVIR